MWILLHLPSCWSNIFLSLLLATLSFRGSYSIPQSSFSRQDSLASLQIPQCALKCFVDAILDDGCANETDFACHCAAGKILNQATVCVAQGCSDKDANEAVSKIQNLCNTITATTSSRRTFPTSWTNKSSRTTSPASSNTIRSHQSASTSGFHFSPTPTSNASTLFTSASPSRTSPPPSATAELVAPIPPSNQLSDGAKAGIAVGVGSFALSVFFGLGWYIRRLKRDLRNAQAATSSPPDDSRRRSPLNIPPPIITRPKSRRGSRRGRRSSRGSEILVSPLSPREMQQFTTITDNGYGIVKRKRGEVLSVVMEDNEEEAGASVREPVPGQREGLSGPLELDGEWTGVQEMPLVVTPRDQSLDRDAGREGRTGYV